MTKSINKVFLLGHVGNDPELRTTAAGSSVASLSLATSHRLKNREGRQPEKTQWHHVVAFGRTADIVREHVKKGMQLHVEGRLETRAWNDKSSDHRKYKTEVIVEELTLLEVSQESLSGDEIETQVTARDYADQETTDDDIPY